ncbi:MAG: 2-oxo acid dehydrogenase subunit E2 [Arsenophonus sp.]|nr:MAG: 2-oxo acid dehydrogenase subunit E2 [Arsenophonus sp.]
MLEIRVPDIGKNEMEVIEIFIKEGDFVNVKQSLMTIEGDKVSMEVPADKSGFIRKINVLKGDKIKSGDLILLLDEKKIHDVSHLTKNEKEKTKITNEIKDILTKKVNFISNHDMISYATPLIRRLAYKYNIDLLKIKGTGRKQRIIREDILNYIKKAINYFQSFNKEENLYFEKEYSSSTIDFKKSDNHKTITLTKLQKNIALKLTYNWQNIPHVTIMENADVTELEKFRYKQNDEIKKTKIGFKITPLVFVIKAVACVLEEMPKFKSFIAEDFKKLIINKHTNIGVAIEIQDGLIVPVIFSVERKKIMEISKELKILVQKAKSNKLLPSEVKGSNFTISSLGNIGSTGFTPIINGSEVAIIGVSRLSYQPYWNGNKFVKRTILPLSLSFDHRVINGADGARFINRISVLLSDIRRLIL